MRKEEDIHRTTVSVHKWLETATLYIKEMQIGKVEKEVIQKEIMNVTCHIKIIYSFSQLT